MINYNYDLDVEIRALADSLEGLTLRGKAVIFGVCACALAPLVELFEQRSQGVFNFSDLDLALNLIEEFAIGSAEATDNGEIRERLMSTVPHGDELTMPWGAYVESVIICADAGLGAASIESHPKSIWIQYALEPLMVSMQARDFATIRAHGDVYWLATIVNDPYMVIALTFLRGVIARLSREGSVNRLGYRRLVGEAAVLRPAYL